MEEIDKLLDDLRSVTINNVKTPTHQLHINEQQHQQQQKQLKKEKMPQSPYLLNEYQTNNNNNEQNKLQTNNNNNNNSKNKEYISELDNLLNDLSYAKQKNNSISSAESISNDSSSNNSNNYLKYTNNNNNNINNNNNNNYHHQNHTNANYNSTSSSRLSSDLSPLSYNNKNNNNNSNNTNGKQYSSRRSLEKLIDTIDNDELIINRNNNNTIQPEVSLEATKELENLMNSLSSYKVTNNGTNNTSNVNGNNGNNLSNHVSHDNNLVNVTKKKDVPQTPLAYNTCQGCGEQINGQVITALGALWHPSHFICHYCETVIGTSIFYEKDGKPYCENDYFHLFSPKCATCQQPILDKMLTALNKQFHPQCFKCSSCSKLLNDESFLEKNNAAFCKDCYVCKLAPKCLHCSNPIVDNFISAMNAYWHPNCFVCTECGIAFNSSSFYEYNGLPYCEIHYHHKRGSLCSSCQQPINGRCITAMNKKFHPQHFVCSFCTKQLNKGTFKEQNDKPYCHPCFFKLFPQ